MIHLTGIQRLELTRLTRIHQDAIGYVQERAQTRTPTLAQLADMLLDEEAGVKFIAPGQAENSGVWRDDHRKTLEYIQCDLMLRRLTLVEYRPGWGEGGLAGIVLEDEDGERCQFDQRGLVREEAGYAQGAPDSGTQAVKKNKRILLWMAVVLCVIAGAIALKVTVDARRRAAAIEELRAEFKAHLQKKYAGTYYDGEFVVDEEIDIGVHPAFGIRYGAEAYREDRPDLPFHVHTAVRNNGREYITDDFFRKIISWEGAHAVADTQIVERIFGKEVLYSGGVGWRDADIEDRLVKRNGYADMINHYAADNTYPWIDIIVYTKTFDEEEACADIVELYNALVAGKSEDNFVISVFYTSSGDTKRGLNRGSGSVNALTSYYNPDNFLAYVNLNYDAEYDDDWRSQYPSFADFITADFKKSRDYLEERVRNGESDR